MTSYKQAILLREDLEMSTGKMITQACHASLKAYQTADSEIRSEWESQGEKKVILGVDGEKMQQKKRELEVSGLSFSAVKDAGKTELEPGTETALSVGPAEESEIDTVTGELKLIK
jgi:PTH2 family peptidyl-tRNA hydrolase